MLNRPHTYMEMLSILSAGVLPRDPTEAEEQRIRASAITVSGAEGAAQDVLDRFSTKGSNTAIEELITATKVLYELFAINARQAAYLVAGATLLGLWPAELVRNASANEPPGDGPHRMVEGIRSALGLQPTGLQDALRSEPLDFAVAPLLLIGSNRQAARGPPVLPVLRPPGSLRLLRATVPLGEQPGNESLRGVGPPVRRRHHPQLLRDRVVADSVEGLPHLRRVPAEGGHRQRGDIECERDQPGAEGGPATADQQHPVGFAEGPVVGDLPVPAAVRAGVEQVAVFLGRRELPAPAVDRGVDVDRTRAGRPRGDVPADHVGFDETGDAGVHEQVAAGRGQFPAQVRARRRDQLRVPQRRVVGSGRLRATDNRDQRTHHAPHDPAGQPMPVRLATPPALTARRDWPHPGRGASRRSGCRDGGDRVTTGGMVRLARVSWRWRQAWVGSGRVSAAVDGIEGVRSSP